MKPFHPVFVKDHSLANQKNVEIFYDVNPRIFAIEDEASLSEIERKEELSKLAEIDYTSSDGKIVKIPTDCRKMRLAMKIYSESPSNTVNVIFTYKFTQNSDKDE